MSHPRCLILCKSVHHGNTAKVAGAIGSVLDAEIASPEEVSYTSLGQYVLIGFGSGVYYGQMHEALHDWLRGLPDAPVPTVPAIVFSTAGLPWLSGLWHKPLHRLLNRKGFRVVGEFSCGGYDTWGPLWLIAGLNRTHPDERDLDRAKVFSAGIARKLSQAEATTRCDHCC